jgi:hypothetical protein
MPQDKRSDSECSAPCNPLHYVSDATLWFASVMTIYDFGEFADGVMTNPASAPRHYVVFDIMAAQRNGAPVGD